MEIYNKKRKILEVMDIYNINKLRNHLLRWSNYFVNYLDLKVPSAGSVDNKFAICAAEASKASQSFEPSSESSPTSNPDMKWIKTI